MTRSLSQEITQPVEVKIEQDIEGEDKQESQESKLVTTAE